MSKNSKIILPQDFYHLLHNKHLLLDTSFFADYSNHPETFVEFVDECKAKKITFVTCIPVIIEFIRGSDTPKIFTDKNALVNKIVDYVLPIKPDTLNIEMPHTVESYGQIGKSISVTDFILAAQTKVHSNDLCLLTKNPRDFPTSIFSVKTHFLLQLERALQVYGVYCYEIEQKDDEVPF